ncbi:hypothetical protein Ahy_A05g025602 [Arachis hypogaea]|uniref:Ethylene-responsive binding factor-associated repression domain-containing protein n=1 Tax=Arachis hypogaea TaxID=3818 RepID=A0A445D946_ARAHY|nr:hypothetical protein Ahy_A05g025602 [Arachis hypogaea]
MAQVVEKREYNITRMSDFSRDLLKKFMFVNHHHHHELQQQQHRHGDGDAEQEIELSLGLLMNSCFGVDPTAKKIRTTSILEFSLSKMKIITITIIIIIIKILGVTLITY